MTLKFWSRTRSSLRMFVDRLRADETGNILITMVAAVVPLTFLIGFGVDYSRAEMLQTQLNAAADAAALAAVDPTIILLSDDKATAAANNMFNAQASKLYGLASYTMTPTISDSATTATGSLGYLRKATVAYQAKSQNLFSGILGVETLSIQGSSTASAQQPPNINFYLAMDNSPSMLLPATSSGLSAVTSGTTTSHLSAGCDFACHEQMPHNDNIYINDTSGRQVLLSTSFYTSGAARQNVYYLWNTTSRQLYTSAGVAMNTVTTTTSGNTSTATTVTYSVNDSNSGPATIVKSTTVATTTRTGSGDTATTSTSTSGPTTATYDTGYWADGYWLTHNYGNLYGSPASITLRKDDVISAATQLIPYAASQSTQYHVTYQMQMFSFNWTHPSAGSPVTTLNPMTNVNSFGSGYSVASLFPADDYWYQNSAPTSSTNNNDQATEFGNMMSYMNGIMPTAGTGAATSTPQEIMFIVTDGMVDELSGGSRVHGPLSSNDLSQCAAIKAKGIKIAVLYTQYLSQALIGDSWSQSNIAPYLPAPPSGFPAGNAGSSDQVLTALRTCASPSSNGTPLVQTVTTDGDIAGALQQLFSTALQAPRLVQ